MEANRKQAMVPEGATALDPVGTAPGLVVPFGDGERRRDRPARARRASCSRCGRWRWRPTAVKAILARGDAAARADDADVRRPGVGNREEPAGDRGRRRGRRRGGRGDHLPAARRDRDRRALARGDRGGGDGGPRRAAAAPPAGDLQPRRARRSTSRWRSCCEGHGRWRLAESCSGGLLAARITDRAGGLGLLRRERRRLLLRGQRRAARGAEGADRGVTARSRRRSPRRWRTGRWSASGPTSRSRSPGSPGRAGGPRRSRSATSASTRGSPTAPSIARDPVIPGGRADIRERSALGRDAPAAHPPRRRRRGFAGLNITENLRSGVEPRAFHS